MDLLKEISENKFLMVLLNERQYESKLLEIVRNIDKNHEMICYVCLSKPCLGAIDCLKKFGLNQKKFFFIDTLSSHYEKPKPLENCVFLKEPIKIASIQAAITKAITEKKCSVIVFDTISSLLVYEQAHDIVRMTHNLSVESSSLNVNKVFIVLKENGFEKEYRESFIKDLGMFADRTIQVE
jgi:hypothetical protein